MKPVRLHIEQPQRQDGQITLAATLEHPDGPELRLWWRLGEEWSDALTTWADPFVVGFVFPIMQWGRDVAVDGRVSPSLLENLETYMEIWRRWAPDKYQAVHIQANREVEAPAPPEPGQTVTPFSCGMDSSFTVLQHRDGLAGRRRRNVTAGVVMNGFDVWLDQPNAAGIYGEMLASARCMLTSKQVDCIPMASNFHDLPVIWGHAFGTHLVSGLGLLAGRFDSALIPTGVDYISLFIRSGDNPLIDRYISSSHFQISDDGNDVGRVLKAEALSQWPEAMRHLRVCYSNRVSHTNCCKCEKCIRVVTAFRISGSPIPQAFRHEITDRQIRRLRLKRSIYKTAWRKLIVEIDKRGLWENSWARAIRTAVRRNRIRWIKARLTRRFLPIRNRIRTLLRGSPLSRSELSQQSAEDRRP